MKKLTEKFGKKKVYAGIAVIIALIILLCIFFYVEDVYKRQPVNDLTEKQIDLLRLSNQMVEYLDIVDEELRCNDEI